MTTRLRCTLNRALALLWLLFATTLHAEDFLDPAQAFDLKAQRVGDEIRLTWTVAPGYHLYAERITVQPQDPAVRIGAPQMPEGEKKFDANFGKVMTHLSGQAQLKVAVLNLPAGPDTFKLKVGSQGCADAGLCYPPQEQVLSLPATPVQAASAPAQAAPAPVTATAASSDARSEDERISDTLQSRSIWKIALSFFGLGLLLSFTPCVLPMIPILSSIIVGAGAAQEGGISRGKGFALSLAYALGMMLVYTSLGVAAGLLGEGLAATLQKPWVIASFALLLFGFGLAMFDVFKLEMPAGLQNRLTEISNRIPGGRFGGVFAMGGLSAMIVGPCVAAPLAGTLVYISKTGDVLIGAIALFSLSFGMSQPLLLTGLSAGRLLPRAGAWMEGVKRFFGVLLFATALWLANPILPQVVFMLAVALLLLMAAHWLSAFSPLPAAAGLGSTTGKALGLMLAGLAALQLIGVASGGRDALQPIRHLAARSLTVPGQTGVVEAGLKFEALRSSGDLATRLASAKGPVVLDFYADWCTSCKEMEHATFSDPRVKALMARATLLRADVTRNSEEDRALLKRYGLFGPPALLVLRQDGQEDPKGRVIGFKPAEPFLAQLAAVLQ